MLSGCFSLAVAQSLNSFCLEKYQERKARFYLQLWKLVKGSYLLFSMSLTDKMLASELTLSWPALWDFDSGEIMHISRSQSGNHSRSCSGGSRACRLSGDSSATNNPMAITISTTVYRGYEGGQYFGSCSGCPISLNPC